MFLFTFLFTLMSTRKILSENIVPENYKILIDTRGDELYGSVSIETTIKKPTNVIKLNAFNLNILDIEIIHGSDTMRRHEIKVAKEEQEIVLSLGKEVSDSVRINISYLGKIASNMNGYYVSEYKKGDSKEKLYSTHFEPTSARRAVPSFDQPDMKATFDVILTVPEGMTGLSNMDVASETDIKAYLSKTEDGSNTNPEISNKNMNTLNSLQIDLLKESPNKRLVFFNTTPKMSTYLLAFVIGSIDKKETKLDDIKINVYAPTGEEKDADYALEVTRECLEYYQNYFKIKYPLPKLDNIAIPNFAMGAMENWGLVTYRKSSLLYGTNSSLETKRRIAETVCHELAHQWFGNLVTMKWWNDLWLNEGFATWASYKAIEVLKKEFPATDFISNETQYGISYDALNSTHPISVEVNDPKEIDQIFDGISYSKGACLINMLEDYLGNDFEKGLVSYLQNNAYGNAETKDLWDSLKVEKLMDDWVTREGVPMITVEEHDEFLVLKQKRFLYVPEYEKVKFNTNSKEHKEQDKMAKKTDAESANKSNNLGKRPSSDLTTPKTHKPSENTWKIPVRISFYGEETELNELYMFEVEEMKIQKKSNIYKLNNDSAGFYITHYKKKSIPKDLLTTIKLGHKDKLNILNDIFNLAKASIIPVADALEILLFYKDETNSNIVSSIFFELSEIKSIFYKDEKQRKRLQSLILELIENKIDNVLSNISGKGLEYNELALHTSIISMAVNNEHESTIMELGKIFKEYKNDKSVIHPNFRSAMFISLMKRYNKGEEELFDELYDLYCAEKSDDVKNSMLGALGSSNNFDFLTEKLLDDEIKTQDKMYLFSSLASNIVTRDRMVAFTIDKFSTIQSIFEDNSSLLGYVVERVFGIVSHRETRNSIIKFLKGVNIDEVDRSVMKCLEKSEIKIRFRVSNLQEFE